MTYDNLHHMMADVAIQMIEAAAMAKNGFLTIILGFVFAACSSGGTPTAGTGGG